MNIMKNVDLHDMALDIKAEYMTAGLITAYHAPVRHYHTLVHALEVATMAKQLMIMSDTVCNYDRVMDVYLAGLWHDAIYTHGNPNNEMLSAQLFSFHYPGRENVARLISKTTIADHLSEDEVDIQLACLLDADVLSLSAPYERFMRNNTNINMESGGNHHTSSSFLMRFVDRKSIYRTDYCKMYHEETARQNIEKYYHNSRYKPHWLK